jgi:Mg2+ and Co2+ transporter CorA
MFAQVKAYISIFLGAIVLGFLAYIKYLKSTNKEQKENIDRLKKEIVVRREVSKDEIKKQVFEAKQRARAEELKKTEITLDEIEKEIKQNEKDNDEHSSNDDGFILSRV